MKPLKFTKMQATGNDFVMVDNREERVEPGEFSSLARAMSDRRYGIGSDGLILLDEDSEGELVMHYKNPDGSDAGMCGNGARCFVRFAGRLGYPEEICFRVNDNTYRGRQVEDSIIVDFPLETRVNELEIDGEKLYQVYTNTEHIVCHADETLFTQPEKLVQKGRTLRQHKTFEPSGTNVNFIRSASAESLEVQTYERGVEDLTLACGTGAIASALARHHNQQGAEGKHHIRINAPGGTLFVHFFYQPSSQTYRQIQLEGPAVTVFKGDFYM